MPAIRHEPFHEPIGLSPETHRISRRWIPLVMAAVAVLAAGGVAAMRLGGLI
jgi:hypothetical protein